MVSKRPAGPVLPPDRTVEWTLFLIVVMAAAAAFFLSSPLLRSVTAAAAAHSSLPESADTVLSPEGTLMQTGAAEIFKPSSLHLDPSEPSAEAELSLPAAAAVLPSQVQIQQREDGASLTTRFSAGSGLTDIPASLSAGASLADLEFLEADITGQEFLWKGSSRQVLYYIGNSQLQITLTLDKPAELQYSSLLSDEGHLDASQINSNSSENSRITMQITLPSRESANAAAAVPASSPVYLPMANDYHSQIYETHLPNACGPAAVLIVLDYYNLENSLAEIIDLMRQVPPLQGGYDPACQQNPVCTSPELMARVFSDHYNLIVQSRSDWSLEDVHEALQRGNPVIADIRWFQQGGTLGHFVVIYGVDPHARTLTYHDPFTGADRTSTWEHFSTRWSGPVDVADPLQPDGFRFWGMEIYPPPAS
jgi:hypothetical protein